MDNATLRKLQLVDLDILDEVVNICDKFNIRYYLISGTLLGAARHKGFIPWDDDIDIGMPRKDYNRFLKVAQQELPEHYFLQHYKTEREYPLHFAKIRNKNTTYIPLKICRHDINFGVSIDIAPLDGVPNFFCVMLLSIYNNAIKRHRFPNVSCKSMLKEIIVKYLVWRYSTYEINKKIDKLMSRIDFYKCKYVANFFGVWGKREIFPRDYFGDGVKLEFEGKMYNCPIKVNEYLSHLYGPSWMIIPSPENWVSHHGMLAIDLEKPHLINANLLKLKEIIKDYGFAFSDLRNLNKENAANFLGRVDKFLSKLKNISNLSNESYDIAWLFPFNDFFSKLDKWGEIELINNRLKKNDLLRYLFMRYLFMNKRYRSIIRYDGLEFADVNYYLGRAFKKLKKFDNAIRYLELSLHAFQDKDDYKFLNRKDITTSAYFHLGEIYYKRRQWDKARVCFNSCITISNNMHNKAREYIKSIDTLNLFVRLVKSFNI